MKRAGRAYARDYAPVRRAPDHALIERAVAASGGQLLFSSGPSIAPLFLGVETPGGERIGLNAYVFHANQVQTKNRPSDEHRAQIRYRDVNAKEWRESEHPLGFDPAGVDLTLVLVAHIDADLIIALDPLAYDPLPLGSSIYFKEAEIQKAAQNGWGVWERDTYGRSRKDEREPALETVIGLKPERFFDLLAMERQAQMLHLHGALRFRAAERGAAGQLASGVHELEEAFDLPAQDILDIIGRKSRLGMAMRGGVAEHHLGLVLDADPAVDSAEEGQQEGPPDFFVEMADGRRVTVECKNASTELYADGTPKVEVQKTRASKGDPTSRFYGPEAFDVVAACMFGPTGTWTFRFRRSVKLAQHPEHAGKIAPLQRITDAWTTTLAEALASER